MRLRDIQQFLAKFTDGQKGTAISDCEVYIEMQDGKLAEISKMELQESKIIGKINSSGAWRVVVKGEPKSFIIQSTTYKKQNPLGAGGKPSGEPPAANMKKDDYIKIYDDLFEHAMHLLNDHQKPPELVAGTMMAIAQRIYKTQLSDDEYQEMMEVIKDAPVKPYNIKKQRLH